MLVPSSADAVLLGGVEQILVSLVIPLALPVLVFVLALGPLAAWRAREERQ